MTKLTMSIKSVEKEAWKSIKVEAARHEMQIGEFLGFLINEHKNLERENNWDAILKSKPTLTKKDADEIKKHAENFRKGFDFR